MLHENIKKLRTEKGLSQEELAARLHVVRQTVSKWEKGLSVPDSQMLIHLADVFEVSVSQLLGEPLEESAEKSELGLIADKLSQLNALLAERNARSRAITRIFGVVLLVLAGIAAAFLLVMLWQYVMLTFQLRDLFGPGANSIGIIGGADGPTAITVASGGPMWPVFLFAGVVLAAVITLAVVLIRKNK